MVVQIMAIALANTALGNVSGNAIINPVAVAVENFDVYSQPFADSSVIYLDVISGLTDVSGNAVFQSDTANVPQVRTFLARFDMHCLKRAT